MTGIRKGYADPDAGWLKLRNDWARDTRIDWGALGLLAYLTSHRDGFDVALTTLYNSRKSKRHKVEGWLEELEQQGYLRRETKRHRGVIVGTTWHLLAPNVDGQH
jgi:hypothetical protein